MFILKSSTGSLIKKMTFWPQDSGHSTNNKAKKDMTVSYLATVTLICFAKNAYLPITHSMVILA